MVVVLCLFYLPARNRIRMGDRGDTGSRLADTSGCVAKGKYEATAQIPLTLSAFVDEYSIDELPRPGN